MLLKEILQEYLMECRIRNYSEETILNKKVYLNQFFTFIEESAGVLEVKQVKKQHVKQFLAFCLDSGNKAVTVNTKVKIIRPFFNYCIEEGYVKENPVLSIKYLKQEKPMFNVFSDEDVAKLLKVSNLKTWEGLRRQCIFAMFIDTGIRVHEVRGLKMADIKSNAILVHGKGNKDRFIPVSPRLRLLMMKYERKRSEYLNKCGIRESEYYFVTRNGGIMKNNTTIQKAIQWACEKAEITDKARCSPHTLRHYYAIKSISLGTPVAQLSRNLGHESLRVTQVYLNQITNETLRADALKHTYSPLMNL